MKATQPHQIAIISAKDDQTQKTFQKIKNYIENIELLKNELQPENMHTAKWNETEIITKTLELSGKKEGVDWLLIKGSSTPAALYRVLFEYREENNIIVLDDIDKIWSNAEATFRPA